MARSLQVDANRNDDDLGGIIVEKTSASLIDGYEILSEIGRGGVGVVYKAKDAVGAFVALKLLQDRRGYLTHRFKCEFQHLIDLDHHPRIARAYQFGIHHDSFYFTSEYIDGSDLCSYLRGRSLLEMIGLFLQVLDALDFIHRHGLVHLDIKSENILVNKKGEAKLLDFGIAMRPEDVDALIGSIPYLAPEVVFGWKEKLDARADLFSFGVLMYRCLTGFFPFARTAKKEKGALQKSMAHEVWRGPPSSINQTVPVWLDTIVERLLNTDPAERWYTSARAVMNALKTHEPEQFREERDDRNAYLIPKGKKHIGREEEQTKLFGLLDGLLQNSAKQPPMVMIEGASGLGKTHLLNKLRERASVHADQLFVSHLALPADDLATQRFCSDVEQKLAENTKPVVVLIDDLPASPASPSSFEMRSLSGFIERLVTFIHTRRAYPELYANTPSILLCVTMSDNGSPTLPAGRQVKTLGDDVCRLTLKPFTLLDLDTYLDSTPAFEHHKPDHTWLEDLHRRTGGIPALIREHLEFIDSKHLLFDLTGKIVMHPSWPEVEDVQHLPGIRHRLEQALSRCTAEEKKILTILAVWNHLHFASPATFNDVFSFLPLTTLKQKLDRLIQQELLTADFDHQTYRFANDLLGSLVYEQLAPEERWYWHGEMTKYLTSSDLLLLHLAHTNPSATAHRALLKLARKRFIHHGDVALARSLLEYALTIVPAGRPNLFACFASVLMEVYQQSGEVRKAENLYAKVVEKSSTHKLWKILLDITSAGMLLQQQRFEESEKKLTELSRSVRAASVHALTVLNYQARLLYDKALHHEDQKMTMLQEAKKLFEKSFELEADLPASARSEVANNNVGLVLMALGENAAAVKALGEKLARHKKKEQLFGVLHTLLALVEAYRQLKHYETAKIMAEQALELAKRINQGKWLLHAHHALSHLYHDSNQFDLALREGDACLAASAVLEDPNEQRMTSLAVWAHKGHCHKELRELNKAILHFQSVLEANAPPSFLVSVHEGLGECCFYRKDFRNSRQHFEQATELLRALPVDALHSYRAAIATFQTKLLMEESTL